MAPEYANTGLLNEKSDIYSFGVLLLEAVTGRDPVDYARPAHEVVNPYEYWLASWPFCIADVLLFFLNRLILLNGSR